MRAALSREHVQTTMWGTASRQAVTVMWFRVPGTAEAGLKVKEEKVWNLEGKQPPLWAEEHSSWAAGLGRKRAGYIS